MGRYVTTLIFEYKNIAYLKLFYFKKKKNYDFTTKFFMIKLCKFNLILCMVTCDFHPNNILKKFLNIYFINQY